MDILEELFYGNIRPCEAKLDSCAYRRASRRVDELEAALRVQLDEGQRAELTALIDAVTALSAEEEAFCFAQGFQLGMRLSLTCLAEKSPANR